MEAYRLQSRRSLVASLLRTTALPTGGDIRVVGCFAVRHFEVVVSRSKVAGLGKGGGSVVERRSVFRWRVVAM